MINYLTQNRGKATQGGVRTAEKISNDSYFKVVQSVDPCWSECPFLFGETLCCEGGGTVVDPMKEAGLHL